WTPVMEQNGACTMKVTAYDVSGQAYESPPLNVTVTMDRKLALAGVSPGMTVSRKVSLIASRNFDVNETTYIMRDVPSGNETVLSKQPWGNYEWFPGPEQSGEKELFVRVINTYGAMYQSSPVKVTVDGSPKLILQGVGPNQVVTGQPKLTVSGNVSMDSVSYILTNSATGAKRTLASNLGMTDTYTYTPQQGDAGKVSIMAEGTYQGRKISSGSIAFTVYLGKIYGPQAIIQKDLYLDFAAGMAKTSWEQTGMSAALQTAQAILETGWGQGVPVDKYSGQLSYNLFGIKGKGTNGSVISNTWEVYNGITYHIDDEFRAYWNVQESWDDHKSLLLNASRYQPFRDVMYSSTLGAWAIKRSGYATDPLYPTKLMRIIRQYGLEELDRTGI
ncbi:MAG: glucosaminidase domain-containing protein, partial [Clostridia bacterium]